MTLSYPPELSIMTLVCITSGDLLPIYYFLFQQGPFCLSVAMQEFSYQILLRSSGNGANYNTIANITNKNAVGPLHLSVRI